MRLQVTATALRAEHHVVETHVPRAGDASSIPPQRFYRLAS